MACGGGAGGEKRRESQKFGRWRLRLSDAGPVAGVNRVNIGDWVNGGGGVAKGKIWKM